MNLRLCLATLRHDVSKNSRCFVSSETFLYAGRSCLRYFRVKLVNSSSRWTLGENLCVKLVTGLSANLENGLLKCQKPAEAKLQREKINAT